MIALREINPESLAALNSGQLVRLHHRLHLWADRPGIDQALVATAHADTVAEMRGRAIEHGRDNDLDNALADAQAEARKMARKSATSAAGASPSATMRIETVKTSADEQRLVMGVVYAPAEPDTDGEWARPEEIRRLAHRFMASKTEMRDMHNKPLAGKVTPVESYIAPVSFEVERDGQKQQVPKGAWVLVSHISDDELWQQIKAGERDGYSFRATYTPA